VEPAAPASTDELIERLEADLRVARLAHDRAAVTALRTLLSAIANAEAPAIEHAPTAIVGQLVDHPRLVLTLADIERIVDREIDDRADTVRQYLAHDRVPEADALRAEMVVLERYRA
jgi:uncharacterized protein YqeY